MSWMSGRWLAVGALALLTAHSRRRLATGARTLTPCPSPIAKGEGGRLADRSTSQGVLPGRLLGVCASALFVAACGSGADGTELTRVITPVASPSPGGPGFTYEGEPAKALTEFRVATINMMSPVSLDSTNNAASETYEQRLDMLIEELKAFKPDVVVLNEWTNTKAHGNPAARLGKELKMEYQWVRANPWFPGQSKEQNDAIADQIGFQEGELILSRHRILRAESRWLNPRTSETEGRAALHVVLQAPAPLGEVDIFVTHLTSGGERVRAAQAQFVATTIKETRGKGPILLMGDLGDVPGSATIQPLIDSGLTDLIGEAPIVTCCRDGIIGELPPVTTRTSYIFGLGWVGPELSTFGDKPKKRADGSLLYASDHNGMFAVFPVRPPNQQPP